MDAAELLDHARRARNRGRCHVFLGHPLSDTCDKTTVEPGNAFSPGLWTCGISLWVAAGQELTAPELLADGRLAWQFGEEPGGLPPVLTSAWRAGPVRVRTRLLYRGDRGCAGCDHLEVILACETPCAATVALVVRDVGPAGGRIRSIEAVGTSELLVDGTRRVRAAVAPDELRVLPPGDQWECPLGALVYRLDLTPGEPVRLAFAAGHGFADRPLGALLPPCAAADETWDQAVAAARADWRSALPARVHAPDPRVAAAWECSAHHVLAAMELGLPRIGVANYPIFWTRDGVMVLRALDLVGRHDLARTGCDYLRPRDFGGGFGAEADAPGEGVWALVHHGLIARDLDWLRAVMPDVERRLSWLRRMRKAREPLRVACDNREPRFLDGPGATLVCDAARNGLIHGRMDWQSPDFYINCWAAGGLRMAARAYRALADEPRAAALDAEADGWEAAIVRHLLPGYGNPRDPAAAPHPTGALRGHADELRARLADWWPGHRTDPDGARLREPEWTYFEAAHAHNALLLGLPNQAGTALDGLLDDAGRPWPVAAWTEGPPGGGECLPFLNGAERRGWLDPACALAGNMPHNWTSAEMICLLRSVFLTEEPDGLVLGRGVPRAWLKPGAEFGVSEMPTDRGPVTYTARVDAGGRVHADYSGPEPWSTAFERD